MPATERERLATVEAELRGLRDDIKVLTAESSRSRKRLHDLEGVAAASVTLTAEHRRQEEAQYRRMEVRMQWLVVAIAALTLSVSVLVPVLISVYG